MKNPAFNDRVERLSGNRLRGHVVDVELHEVSNRPSRARVRWTHDKAGQPLPTNEVKRTWVRFADLRIITAADMPPPVEKDHGAGAIASAAAAAEAHNHPLQGFSTEALKAELLQRLAWNSTAADLEFLVSVAKTLPVTWDEMHDALVTARTVPVSVTVTVDASGATAGLMDAQAAMGELAQRHNDAARKNPLFYVDAHDMEPKGRDLVIDQHASEFQRKAGEHAAAHQNTDYVTSARLAGELTGLLVKINDRLAELGCINPHSINGERNLLDRKGDDYRLFDTRGDYLTAKYTAFNSMAEMVAAPGYTPSIIVDHPERAELADLYDMAQPAGSLRRAFRTE